jgi:hypothetical protein
MIGAMKYLAQRIGTPITMQPASIKKPAFAGITAAQFPMPKGNQHVKDAVAHGWWWHYGGDTPE